jgi:hypothetical protein
MPLASPRAEPCFELNEGYFRRAWVHDSESWGVTDSPGRWRDPCASSPEINRPAIAGIRSFEKFGGAASGLWRAKGRRLPSKKRAMSKTAIIREAGDPDVNPAPQVSCQGSVQPTVKRGAGSRFPEVWAEGCSGDPLALKGNGASLKAHGGTRTVKGQAGIGAA